MLPFSPSAFVLGCGNAYVGGVTDKNEKVMPVLFWLRLGHADVELWIDFGIVYII